MKKITFVYKGRYFVRDSNTLEYLSSIAKNYGYSTDLFYEQDIFGITDNVLYLPYLNKIFCSARQTVKKIIQKKPEFVVFLKNFNNVCWIKEISVLLKQYNPEIKVVVIFPFDVFSDIKYDYLLIGEPESVFADFLSRQECKTDGLKEIKVETLSELDNLPLPDKELFSKYVNFSNSYMVYTSKGCTGECSYCEETIYKNKFPCYYRRRSPDNVIKELIQAKKTYNPKEIIFKDSVFTADINWLKEFLGKYRKEINVPFKCFGKADIITEEIIKELKHSGCYCIEFGMQTANENIRKNVLFRKENISQLIKAFRLCDRYKIRYDIDHMFGLPYESIDDHINATRFYAGLSFLNRIKCHNLTYYRGAKILDFAMDNGDLDKELMEKINNGETGDFFSQPVNKKKLAENECFKKLFKILPLINKNFIEVILKYKLWRFLKYIPNIVLIFLQLFIALKHGDIRFNVYLKHYPRRIWFSVKNVC